MKTVFISFLLVICFFPLNTFGECIEGNCVNGKGTFISPDKTKYVGEFKNGKFVGKGTFTYPDGSKLIGKFKNGDFIGRR